jgi:hypothetical protein
MMIPGGGVKSMVFAYMDVGVPRIAGSDSGLIAGKLAGWKKWRRRRDSNSRRTFTLAGFQDQCIQPLCHPSAGGRILQHLLCVGKSGMPSVKPNAWGAKNRKALRLGKLEICLKGRVDNFLKERS